MNNRQGTMEAEILNVFKMERARHVNDKVVKEIIEYVTSHKSSKSMTTFISMDKRGKELGSTSVATNQS